MTPVLVVDDHEAFLQVVTHALSRHGYRPIIATSAATALRLLETEPVELAVIDVMMPDMDGIELLRAIRERHPDLPVVAMTGAADAFRPPLVAVMRVLGACAVLEKPFPPAVLIQTIEENRAAATSVG